MYKFVMSFFLMIVAVSCAGPRYVDYFPYNDEGIAKPRIVVMPVLDRVNPQVPWSVSEELTDSLYYSLMNSGELYVLSPQEIGQAYTQYSAETFFGEDLSCCRYFCNADFIVAIEIIDHGTVEDVRCNPCNRIVNLRARVKAIDTRCQCPTVVLYEIIEANYKTAGDCSRVNYENYAWGTDQYCRTPLYTAHSRLVANITDRLEKTFRVAR